MEEKRFGKRRLLTLGIAGVCLIVAAAIAISLLRPASAGAADCIAGPSYPQMAHFPNDVNDYDAYTARYAKWSESRAALYGTQTGATEGLSAFYQSTAVEYLTDAEGKNRVYSPLNIYLALSMLAETTDGNSRAQILKLLNVDSVEALRDRVRRLWIANYCDDGIVTSKLANSLWMNERISYVPQTLETLAKDYYASSFQGTMGSEEYNQMLRDWINEQTGGLLKEQTQSLEMDPRTVLALASTAYFKGRWENTFYEGATAPDTFHAPDGEQTVDFMHQELENADLYAGEDYCALPMEICKGGKMWLILPDENKTIDDVLTGGEALQMVQGGWEQRKNYAKVRLSMPKFDVDSDFDLIDGLRRLGVTDVFDDSRSDFTPLTRDMDQIYVSKAEHAARVKVNEEGCEAAAYTVLMMECGAALIEGEEVDFTLDRPFLFVLTGLHGDLLFIGAVNQP